MERNITFNMDNFNKNGRKKFETAIFEKFCSAKNEFLESDVSQLCGFVAVSSNKEVETLKFGSLIDLLNLSLSLAFDIIQEIDNTDKRGQALIEISQLFFTEAVKCMGGNPSDFFGTDSDEDEEY